VARRRTRAYRLLPARTLLDGFFFENQPTFVEMDGNGIVLVVAGVADRSATPSPFAAQPSSIACFFSGMGLGFGRKEAGSHAASFLLGAALPTALLFLLASDRLGEGLSSISRSWGSGAVPPAGDGANEVGIARDAYCTP
jgi:hypothetical protein